MRQGVDADPEFPDLIGLLKNLAIDPAGMQHQGCGQPTNSAANDDCFHAARHPLQNHDPSCPQELKTQ